MCKCCQSCFESCYWHCIGKWVFDENIALYEDPLAEEKDRRSFDNVAFWDSVAVIANRSIVTIQPLPDQKLNNNNPEQNELQPIINQNKTDNNEKNKNKDKNDAKQSVDITDSSEKVKTRKQSAVEEKIEQKRSGSISQEAKSRKKSLKERRKSAAGLTLKLDKAELPVIRQASMPRFFLDTPEVDSHGSYGSERSNVLMSPSLGNSPTFNYDLKSIVQIENEIIASHSKPSTPKQTRSNRLNQVRKKMKPIIIKKPSSKSLPDSINHM